MNNTNELTIALNTFLQSNPWVIVILIWEAIWKGIALYKAARNRQQFWFVALLIFNTVGILPILYISLFQRDKNINSK